jgi:hypothetical protein
MKRFSFIAGNTADGDAGMVLHIDRSALPDAMTLGMWLDDDGEAFPKFDRPAITRHKRYPERPVLAEWTLLDPARVEVKMGGLEGVVSLQPGTRFEVDLGRDLGPISVRGGAVEVRRGLRYTKLLEREVIIDVGRQPFTRHVMTIEAEKPPGSRPGDRFPVEVVQRNRRGEVVGGLTAVFVFD